MKFIYSFILLLLCPFLLSGQSSISEKEIAKNLLALELDEAKKSVSKLPEGNNQELRALVNIIANRGQEKEKDSILISNLKNHYKNPEKELVAKLAKGYYILYYNTYNSPALTYFREAYSIAEINNNTSYLKLSLIGVLELYCKQYSPNTKDHLEYLEQYRQVATTEIDEVLIIFYENRYNGLDVSWPDAYYESSKKLIKTLTVQNLSTSLKGRIRDDISIYYREKNIDSAIYYIEQNLRLPQNNYNKKLIFGAMLELAGLSAKKNDTKNVQKYLYQIQKYYDLSDTIRSKFVVSQFKALHIYKPLKQYDSAFFNLEKAYLNRALIGIDENKDKMNDLNARLNTAEKEKEILIKEQENQKQQYILIALGILLALSSLIAILINRNTKRKQRIAEQERELEIQKKEKILKDQELTTIDAIISGQEKERQRLASDLHDSVGATLAAAKLQFHHLSKNRDNGNQTEELFEKTGKLLDDAYIEIRSMAHVKNSGVIAKNGLLPAVQKLARNASGINGLHIEIEDFGLEERLENSLEISVFRIIQELVTNIIKHSHATEASVAINQYNDSLNIIVEDNGNGFDARSLQSIDGMGLGSIEKRIEHLEGTMEVDSTLKKGTTILIDIPL